MGSDYTIKSPMEFEHLQLLGTWVSSVQGRSYFKKLMWDVTECNFEHFSEDLQYSDIYGKGTVSVQTTELVFKHRWGEMCLGHHFFFFFVAISLLVYWLGGSVGNILTQKNPQNPRYNFHCICFFLPLLPISSTLYCYYCTFCALSFGDLFMEIWL